MRYVYGEGVEKPKSNKLPFALLAIVVLGAYAYVNAQAPVLLSALQPSDATAKKLSIAQPAAHDNRLYVPKINLDTAVSGADGDEVDALQKGAVQRSPASGDPKNGGNYVLAAHRFSFALTPAQTNSRSTFYHLDKLAKGDDVFVDYDGVRYAYKVDGRAKVDVATDTNGSRTEKPQLTLYSLEADATGKRDVVRASLVGEVVWASGKPRLKAASSDSSL